MKYEILNKFFIILFCIVCVNADAQQVYIDTVTRQEYVFVGSTQKDSLKFLHAGELKWIKKGALQQTDILTTKQFLKRIFSNKLFFSAESEEPFWSATISGKELVVSSNNSINKHYKIGFVTNDLDIDNSLYFSFKEQTNRVFGFVRRVPQPENGILNCDLCLCQESSVFEIFIQIGTQIFKGCVTIQKKGI